MFPHVQTQAVHFWQEFHGNDVYSRYIAVHPVAGGPSAGGGTLDHLVRVLGARFLHCKANLRNRVTDHYEIILICLSRVTLKDFKGQ